MSEINGTGEIPEVNFPINLWMIEKYQYKQPSLKVKYEMGNYQKGSIIQSSVLYCYHMYLLHLDMDRT